MTKASRTKRILKIIGGLIIFFTLPSLLFYGFIYLKYNEELPVGKIDKQADALAMSMLTALDFEAYKNTDYLEWTFKGRHFYKWFKANNRCEVYWDDFKVELDLRDHDNSKVFIAEQEYNGIEKHDYTQKAEAFFNNDSFWLFAPYKVFDNGVERRIVETEDGDKSLLVTYTKGGTTPGDSYLWHFDKDGKPKSFQMWVDILPIGGIEATWENWMITESGAMLPTLHKILFLGLEIDDVKGTVLKD